MEKRKIIIMGAGIGGMSAAHELSKHSNYFDITIIEHNKELGGQMTEINTNNTENSMPICWHVIQNDFKYFLDIMNEITDETGGKVISSLVPFNKFVYNVNNNTYVRFSNSFLASGEKLFSASFKRFFKSSPALKDRLILSFIYLYAQVICDKRLETLDAITWKEYIGNLSPSIKHWILDAYGIILNVDCDKMSAYFMYKLIRNRKKTNKLALSSIYYTFNESIKKVLFDPWRKYLERRGVKFLLEHSVTNIYNTSTLTTMSSIDVMRKDSNGNYFTEVMTADIFINSLDIKSLARLYPIKNSFNELYEYSKQIQTPVIFYLPDNFKLINKDLTVLILPSTDWFLMLQIGEIHNIKDRYFLMCGIGLWNKTGTNHKSAVDCTREEIAIECWNQLSHANNPFNFNKDKIPEWSIFDSFQFDKTIFKINTDTPKFSNNINTLHLRPYYKDDYFQNLYHATAYVKTNTNTYNIESAAEAGIIAARIILSKITSVHIDDVIIQPVSFGEDKLSILLKIARFTDTILLLFSNEIKKCKSKEKILTKK